jgi:hypothetical protein
MSLNLTLRRASISRPSSSGDDNDYDVFDGERDVGRIYCVTDYPGSPWFWGMSFQATGRKSYGYADSLEEAEAAFKAEYERWFEESR